MSEGVVILLVEDREDDIVLIQRSLEKAQFPKPAYVVRDGEEAIQYLSGAFKYADRSLYPLPELILLDLKMPRMDGFQTLQWIRSQKTLQGIAVLVLTSSNQIRDVNRAYALGANSFLVKPSDFENYTELCATLRTYWLKTVMLPQSLTPPTETAPSQNPIPPPAS